MTDNAVYKVRYCLGKNKSTVHVLYRCMQLFIFLLNKSGSPLYKYKCTSGSLAFLYIWYSDLHFLLSNKWKYPYEFYMLLHIVNIMIKPPKMWFHQHWVCKYYTWTSQDVISFTLKHVNFFLCPSPSLLSDPLLYLRCSNLCLLLSFFFSPLHVLLLSLVCKYMKLTLTQAQNENRHG